MYKTYAEDVVDWYATGPQELTIHLSDGNVLIYDSLYDDVLFLNERDAELVDEEMYLNNFSINLHKVISEKRLTQSQLSKMTGITQSLLSRYITGQRIPGIYNLHKLCEALECSETRLINLHLFKED